MSTSDYLHKLKKYFFKYKRLPTYEEMLSLFGFKSKNAAYELIHKWIKEGLLKKQDGKLSPTSLFFTLPLLGSIKAGPPTVEDQYATEGVVLEDYLLSDPAKTYLLRVQGDSMIGEGIHPGDLVILDNKRLPTNGDIIAALVDGEWTLKFYIKEGARIKLVAANSKYQPIEPQHDMTIGGVVVSSIRKYY